MLDKVLITDSNLMPNFAVAIKQHQFLGCWGKFSGYLSQLVTTEWNVYNQTQTDGTLVSLSADGLSQPHAWVKVIANNLILGREMFGRVSLYWTTINQTIWFASRLDLLLPLVESIDVNIAALYGYSCFSYVPTPLTPIKDIQSIPAGTELTWAHNANILEIPQSQRIGEWQERAEKINHEQEAIAQLQILLKDAIARQVIDLKDEPVGVFLSGGLDSSIVAALLVQAGVKVRAYSLDFGLDRSISEYPYAEQVAQWLNIPLIKVDATPKAIQAAILSTINALDLPFGDGVTVPLYLLNQAASQDVNIVFNGEGGDQLFAGWTNKPIIAASIYQTRDNDQAAFVHNYLQTFHRLWGYEAQVFQPQTYAEIQHLQPQAWLDSALAETSGRSLLHRLRRASLMLKGAQNIHPRATNLAFANGLWVRSPFCDLALAEWTFRLSGELCLHGACEKYILKRAAEGLLPPEIIWRTKRGMGVPLSAWCLGDWWLKLGVWLNPNVLASEGRWQPNLGKRVALGQLGGKIQGRRIGEILWLLIVWQLWRSQVLREPSAKMSVKHPFWLPYKLWRYSSQWF